MFRWQTSLAAVIALSSWTGSASAQEVELRNAGSVTLARVSVAGSQENLLGDRTLAPGGEVVLDVEGEWPLQLLAYPVDPGAPRQWNGTVRWDTRRIVANYAQVSPLRPLYLAIGVRVGGGLVAGGSGIVSLGGEAAVAIEIDDFGVGVVGRAGPSWVGSGISPWVTTGLVGYEEVELALFGMRPTDGFFSRGAYLGLGWGWLGPESAGPTFTFHQPIARIGAFSNVALDVRTLWEIFGSSCSNPACGPATDHSPFLVVEAGLSWSLGS